MNETVNTLYFLFQAVFVILDVLLLAFFIFLVAKSWKYRPHFRQIHEPEVTYTLGTAVLQERWDAIIKRSRINSQESIKLSVIDADNMVDELLKRMGLEGEHMADRLENLSPDDFKTLNRVWNAHRVRNRIVHEPGFYIPMEDTTRVLEDYASFLREIGAIQR